MLLWILSIWWPSCVDITTDINSRMTSRQIKRGRWRQLRRTKQNGNVKIVFPFLEICSHWYDYPIVCQTPSVCWRTCWLCVLKMQFVQDYCWFRVLIRRTLNKHFTGFIVWLFRFGLDLSNGTARNNLKAGVLEPALTKIKAIRFVHLLEIFNNYCFNFKNLIFLSIRFATEAAVTILRIDDLIKLAPEPEMEEQE